MSLPTYGQHVCALSPSEQNTELCLRGYSYFEDNINASFLVDDILAKINIENTFFITKVCDGINNALATKIGDTRYILLDIDWMEGYKYGKSDWFHLFVIGHEVGHHILNHLEYDTKTNAEGRLQELEADEFSGYILGTYGATEEDIRTLLMKFPENNNTNSTHPQKKDRNEAVKKGYLSSKKSESNYLIQSITKNEKLNLINIPNLISLARNNSIKFINSGDKNYLTKSISYYKQAIRFYKEPQVEYELAFMLLANGDKKLFFETLEHIYKSSNKVEFLIELLSSSISLNYNTDYFISKYNNLLKNISIEDINNVHAAISLSRCYNYMALKNVNISGIESSYLSKTYKILNRALSLNASISLPKQTNYYSNGEINNEFGLIELRQDHYEKALTYFLKSKANFEKANEFNDNSQEQTHFYYSQNILTVYSNIAGTYVRLRDWENGHKNTNLYLNYWSSLNYEQRNYLIEIKDIDKNLIYYFRGRCQHGLGKYSNALISYNQVLNSSDISLNPGATQFYRGLSYLALGQNNKSCIDFKYACDQGIDKACVRYKTMCKN